ncbi:MAG TPA: alpha/beta hydrolase, partial [Geminicoccaceae bacterium]
MDATPILLPAGEGLQRRDLAVRLRPGSGPAVVWLGGFRSDMGATKALALDAWAGEQGRALVRFDYTGHGESSGDFAASAISTWLEDAQAVLDAFAPGPAILVGSSMGGWIACLVARALLRRGRPAPAGLVLIAPALDFTEALMWNRFDPDVRTRIERDGVWMRTSEYSPDPVPITRGLIEDGRRHLLL